MWSTAALRRKTSSCILLRRQRRNAPQQEQAQRTTRIATQKNPADCRPSWKFDYIHAIPTDVTSLMMLTVGPKYWLICHRILGLICLIVSGNMPLLRCRHPFLASLALMKTPNSQHYRMFNVDLHKCTAFVCWGAGKG